MKLPLRVDREQELVFDAAGAIMFRYTFADEAPYRELDAKKAELICEFANGEFIQDELSGKILRLASSMFQDRAVVPRYFSH